MKRIVFIVTDRNRNNLHVGLSGNMMNTMDFFKKMPNLFFDAGQQLTKLIYFEEFSTENVAEQRFKNISRFTRSQKEKLIRSANVDWIDLTPGLAYENNRGRQRQMIQSVLSFAS